MQLHHSATSPFVRAVMVLLHEAGAADTVTLVPTTGSPVDAGTMPVDRNPLGKMPVLVTDEGTALYDSRVICRWIDARHGLGLYPAGEALWPALTLEALAHGIMEAGVLIVYESRTRPEALRHEPWVEGQWAKIARALDALEAGGATQLRGPLDIGQVALGCALGHLDLRHAARDWQAARPGLADWWAAFDARPSMAATRPHLG